MKLLGIHHITAMATQPQRNVDFYERVLGLRLVKCTVNFDDPSSYHLYYGDRTGRPGTIVTFFPWPLARRGTRGTGQVVAISFAIAESALDFWKTRCREYRVPGELIKDRFGSVGLRFADPDGLQLEMIASEKLDEVDVGYESAVAPEFAIHGLQAPTLEVQHIEATAQMLEILGFKEIAEEKNARRFSLLQGKTSARIDVIEQVDGRFGVNSAGTVHHIAFRCRDQAEQLQWRRKLVDLGFYLTPVVDRKYFHSIYFREPGGILFEIATDGPGFAVDEPVESLGESLQLPAELEADRPKIQCALPPISIGKRKWVGRAAANAKISDSAA